MAITGTVAQSATTSSTLTDSARVARPFLGTAGLAEHLVVPLDHRELRPPRHRAARRAASTGRDGRHVSGHVYDVERYGDTRLVPVRSMELHVGVRRRMVRHRQHGPRHHRRPRVRVARRDRRRPSRCATAATARSPASPRGMTRWTCGDLAGAGLSEYLDQVVDDLPVGITAGSLTASRPRSNPRWARRSRSPSCARLTGGASRETWSFTANGEELILRRDPPGRRGAPASCAARPTRCTPAVAPGCASRRCSPTTTASCSARPAS